MVHPKLFSYPRSSSVLYPQCQGSSWDPLDFCPWVRTLSYVTLQGAFPKSPCPEVMILLFSLYCYSICIIFLSLFYHPLPHQDVCSMREVTFPVLCAAVSQYLEDDKSSTDICCVDEWMNDWCHATYIRKIFWQELYVCVPNPVFSYDLQESVVLLSYNPQINHIICPRINHSPIKWQENAHFITHIA